MMCQRPERASLISTRKENQMRLNDIMGVNALNGLL